MTANELRDKYIKFFVSHGHTEIPGRSLIPENDPTVLFIIAGMQPLVPYLLGEEHPAGTRLVDCQKCVRTIDIDAVGDPTHLTFFEMLGNWSLGDYFKDEAIRMSYEFLTAEEYLGLDPESLSVTVFRGDDPAGGDAAVPPDEESVRIWRLLGIPEERIYRLGREDNWWSTGTGSGPCGPDTEMFIDTGRDACGPECRPGCSCGKYFEIWNDVFMEYNQRPDGTYEPLERKCVDTGMGIERTITMLQGKKSVFETELFTPLLTIIEKISGKRYGDDEETDRSMRIIADHAKTSVFILGDDNGVTPSNLGQGYVLRRIIRRAIRHGRKIGIEGKFLQQPAESVLVLYNHVYPELTKNGGFIITELEREEEKFLNTLQKGEYEFNKLLPNLLKNPKRIMPGRVAFRLYDTYGFPIEITEELAAEHGLTVDREAFDEAFRKHQELSKQGADKSFKGGLADQGEMTTALHTATHLLHAALRDVLGGHVSQKGSNITPERLRFDFAHHEKMTEEELSRVEEIVNEKIDQDLPVDFAVKTLDEAKQEGALAFFGDRYDEKVKVYAIGDYSKEVCGGPHVKRTAELGRFKIKKEQSSSAGVRRIRAVLER